MTALNLASIPSNINTYERLFVWAGMACQSINNGQQVNVVENGGQLPQAQVSIVKTADNVDRFMITAYMPCNYAELNNKDQKTWMAAIDIATAPPHSNLLEN